MVMVTLLTHAKIGPSDHQKDASHLSSPKNRAQQRLYRENLVQFEYISFLVVATKTSLYF